MKKYKVHVCNNSSQMEISAAYILAQYFQVDIFLVQRRPNSKTADFKIKNQFWEMKSPRGSGKYTISNNLRKANRQSQNIIIDLRRSRFRNFTVPLNRIKYELSRAKTIKHLLVITKSSKIIDIK